MVYCTPPPRGHLFFRAPLLRRLLRVKLLNFRTCFGILGPSISTLFCGGPCGRKERSQKHSNFARKDSPIAEIGTRIRESREHQRCWPGGKGAIKAFHLNQMTEMETLFLLANANTNSNPLISIPMFSEQWPLFPTNSNGDLLQTVCESRAFLACCFLSSHAFAH